MLEALRIEMTTQLLDHNDNYELIGLSFEMGEFLFQKGIFRPDILLFQ